MARPEGIKTGSRIPTVQDIIKVIKETPKAGTAIFL
jgi:hypothetical protein